MTTLVLKFKEAVIKEFKMEKDVMTIGRKDDNDLPIDNMAVSGHHAKIYKEGMSYVLEDLNSTNGTYVNDKQIAKCKLSNNDEILVGKHIIVFQVEKDEPALSATGENVVSHEETVVISPKKKQEVATPAAPVEDKKPQVLGILTIIDGAVDDNVEIELTRKLTIVGKVDNAHVKAKGFLLGKASALINRRPDGYTLTVHEKSGKIKVNGDVAEGQVTIDDGDVIEVGATKMVFNLNK